MSFINKNIYRIKYFLIFFLFSSYVFPLPNMVLTNCNIIDGNGGPIQKGMHVVIRDDRIYKISKGPFLIENKNEATIIDLNGSFILPGLWNNHTHLSDLLPDINNILGTENSIQASIRAGRNAMDALKRGFTSLRSTGSRDYLDIYWGKAFEQGVFIGPTIYSAGNPIAAEDGHGIDDYAWPATIPVTNEKEMADAVKKHIDMGVKWIKIMADELTKEQIKIAVKIAHENNVKVVAHAAEKGAYRAVNIGVDCIEHGYDLSDKTLKLMAKKGTYYDPTIVCNLSSEYIKERERKITDVGIHSNKTIIDGRVLVAFADERSSKVAIRQRRILMRANELGVKITPGGDSNPLDEIGLLEIEQLAFSGLDEMQTLMAATKISAEMNGVLDDVGTIESGKIADIIVLKDNPLEHISNIRKLEMVIKNGSIVDLSIPESQKSFWELYFKKKEDAK